MTTDKFISESINIIESHINEYLKAYNYRSITRNEIILLSYKSVLKTKCGIFGSTLADGMIYETILDEDDNIILKSYKRINSKVYDTHKKKEGIINEI